MLLCAQRLLKVLTSLLTSSFIAEAFATAFFVFVICSVAIDSQYSVDYKVGSTRAMVRSERAVVV